jgi:hypothetical protein
VKKKFNYPSIDEDDHDKAPDVTRISVLRQSSYHGTEDQGRLKERNEELEDDPEESDDEPARMIEISVDITDELKIEIAEDYDMINSQRRRHLNSVAGKKALPRQRNVIDEDQQPEETESAQLKIVGDAEADMLNQRLEKYHEIVRYRLEENGGTFRCPELACTRQLRQY